jgi:hypothetical protein
MPAMLGWILSGGNIIVQADGSKALNDAARDDMTALCYKRLLG